MSDLPKKVALVTGASRGIGRASALAIGNSGARVLVRYSSGRSSAEDVAAEITKIGGTADIEGVDLSEPRVRACPCCRSALPSRRSP